MMQKQDSRVWMLVDAIAVLEGVDRMRRPLFGIGTAEEGVSWEPPVDMFADESALAVLVAEVFLPALWQAAGEH